MYINIHEIVEVELKASSSLNVLQDRKKKPLDCVSVKDIFTRLYVAMQEGLYIIK